MGIEDSVERAIQEHLSRSSMSSYNDPNYAGPSQLRSLNPQIHRQRMPRPHTGGRHLAYQHVGISPNFERDRVYEHLDTRKYRNSDGSFHSTPTLGAAIINYATARSHRKEQQRLEAEAQMQASQMQASQMQASKDSAAYTDIGYITNTINPHNRAYTDLGYVMNTHNPHNPADYSQDPFGKQLTKRTPDAFGNVPGYSRPNTTPFTPTANPWQQVANKVASSKVPQFVDPSVAAHTRPMLSQTPFTPTANPWQQVADKIGQQRSFSGQVGSQLNNPSGYPSASSTGVNAGKVAYNEVGENKEALNLAVGAYQGPNTGAPAPVQQQPAPSAQPSATKAATPKKQSAPKKAPSGAAQPAAAPTKKPSSKAAAKANLQKEKSD